MRLAMDSRAVIEQAKGILMERRRVTADGRDLEIALRIQPDEGIALTVLAKTPGPDVKLGPVMLDFHYGDAEAGAPAEPGGEREERGEGEGAAHG